MHLGPGGARDVTRPASNPPYPPLRKGAEKDQCERGRKRTNGCLCSTNMVIGPMGAELKIPPTPFDKGGMGGIFMMQR